MHVSGVARKEHKEHVCCAILNVVVREPHHDIQKAKTTKGRRSLPFATHTF